MGIESGYGQRVKMADPTKVEDYWFSDEFVEDMKLLKDWRIRATGPEVFFPTQQMQANSTITVSV